MKNITDKEKSNYYEMDESQIRLNVKSAHAYSFEKTDENAWNITYYKRKYGKRQSPYSTGHIYVLQNTSFPGIFKIGFTERLISERLHDINRSSGMITPWQVRDFFLLFNTIFKRARNIRTIKRISY
jgi:hypothetical protein